MKGLLVAVRPCLARSIRFFIPIAVTGILVGCGSAAPSSQNPLATAPLDVQPVGGKPLESEKEKRWSVKLVTIENHTEVHAVLDDFTAMCPTPAFRKAFWALFMKLEDLLEPSAFAQDYTITCGDRTTGIYCPGSKSYCCGGLTCTKTGCGLNCGQGVCPPGHSCLPWCNGGSCCPPGRNCYCPQKPPQPPTPPNSPKPPTSPQAPKPPPPPGSPSGPKPPTLPEGPIGPKPPTLPEGPIGPMPPMLPGKS